MNEMSTRVRAFSPGRLAGIRRGIEKESLRVTSDGALALTPHPPALGSPLTHPHITTDFSESQLELITGAHAKVDDCLAELTRIHQFVYHVLAKGAGGAEALWACSMPCSLPADDRIPLGRYGSSNVGRMKTIYRNGLSYRYGRRMQTISGIHYNFSLPDTSSAQYFSPGCRSTCSAPRPPSARASSRGAATSSSRCARARCICRTRRPCAWGASATRATRRRRSA
jgi:glutamate--cysteine ligase